MPDIASIAYLPEPAGSALAAAVARLPRGAAAVFDWDNTCIFNDIGDAAFDRALRTDDLRLAPDERAALLPGPLRDGPWSARRAEMHALYEDLETAVGATRRYEWVASLLAGRTDRDLEALAEAAIDEGLAAPLAVEVLRTGAGGGGDAGREVRVPRGLRLYEPIVGLQRTLLAAGLDVRIVTASAAPLVRAFARRAGLDPDRVIGVRLDRDPATGRLLPRALSPFPYAEGKVAAIDRFIGRRPALVAGDSPGDLPMLRAATHTRLVIERDPRSEAARVARAEGWLVVRAEELLGPASASTSP